MTQPLNNKVSSLLGNLSQLPLDTTVNAGAINSGDLCYWTGNGVASYGSGLALNASLLALLQQRLGVSRDTNPLTAGGITNPIATVGIDTEGLMLFNTTASDVYEEFTQVTIGADAQTITVAPAGPAATGASATGTTGTWTAGTHVLTGTFLTTSGETTPGVSASVAVAATNYIETPVVSLPSYALGICWYVDGLFVAFDATGAATSLLGPNNSATRVAPTQNALAIGCVLLRTPFYTVAPPATITGGAGVTVQVALFPAFPAATLL